MNIKVRIKNKTFWLTAVPALVTLIYCILGLFNIVPTISEATVVKILTTIISALTTLGVFVDPTTAGVKDSQRAMSYTKPFKDIKNLFNINKDGSEENDD
ncbi:MAG: phage holin [Clostridia bacterium]|nr:phage holin [Clostridia bacterium]